MAASDQSARADWEENDHELSNEDSHEMFNASDDVDFGDESVPFTIESKNEDYFFSNAFREKIDKALEARREKLLAKANWHRLRSQAYFSLPIYASYAIEKCMDALEKLGDIDQEQYNKACENFVNPEFSVVCSLRYQLVTG